MLEVYYCTDCKRVYYLSNRNNGICKGCSAKLIHLDISYEKFTVLDKYKREEVIEDSLK